jgi:hypothetical protein
MRFIKDSPFGSAHLAQDDLGEHANHEAFLSLPCGEIALGLHDTVQTEPTRPGPVGREGPSTIAQAHQRAERAGEGPSSARARKAGDHSDSGGPPRESPGARRRGGRVPFARRRNSPRPGSWHAFPEMQHTVLFVLGLKGTMSEAELHMMRQRLSAGRLSKVARGEYIQHLPTGLMRTQEGRVEKDPDEQIQRCIALVFSTFAK